MGVKQVFGSIYNEKPRVVQKERCPKEGYTPLYIALLEDSVRGRSPDDMAPRKSGRSAAWTHGFKNQVFSGFSSRPVCPILSPPKKQEVIQ